MSEDLSADAADVPTLGASDRHAAVSVLEKLLAEVRAGRIDGGRPALPAALESALIALRSLGEASE